MESPDYYGNAGYDTEIAMKNRAKAGEIELAPDAWQCFERAVDVVAKSPPQHRRYKKVKPKQAPIKKRMKKKSQND
jgi:hypothetical protein